VSDYLMVIAQSGRMIAQAAVRAGFRPLVIDLLGDCDTLAYAVDFRPARSLAWADLRPAVEFFIGHYPVGVLVYGSGFECHQDSLNQLAKRIALAGNPPGVFARLNDKALFFQVLAHRKIPFPQTRFSPPGQAKGWLVKPQSGQGGVGIRPAGRFSGQGACYWQKYQAGIAHSVLFLADGENAQVVGFNRQWAINLGAGQEFMFSGIINHADVARSLQSELIAWIRAIVPAFSLRGLNALDFIMSGGRAYVLEVNARIPASMQLYGGDLLRRHIQAGAMPLLLPQAQVRATGCRAYQVVYAPEDIKIPDGFIWPEDCVDLPQAGSICRKGRPICSIIAHHPDPDVVLQQLEQCQHILLNQLNGKQNHGIQSQR